MDDGYASRIAAEAVGERVGDSTSEAAKANAENRPKEPVATSAGPQARMAEKAAEAVGERVADAYADATPGEARERSREVIRQATSRHATQALARQFEQEPFVTILAAFGLGCVAGLLIAADRRVRSTANYSAEYLVGV